MTRDEFEASTLEKDADIFRNVDALATTIEDYLRTLAIKREDGLTLIKSGLLLRLATGLEALRLLASRGYFSEAVGQKRSLMEALARLAALCKKPELFDEYLAQDQLNRQKILKDIVEFRKSWEPSIPREPSDEEILAKLTEVQKEIENYEKTSPRKLRDIKTFDWAKHGEVEHLFHGVYPISSQALHHAPRDLERRLVITEGQLTGILSGPEPGDIAELLLSASKLVFVGFQWFAISIKVDLPATVDELYKAHSSLYEKYAAAAIG